MIHSKALSFAYDNKQRFSFPDINCKQGEHLLILGQSGCGKTTLLHLLGGLLRPSTGSIYIGDTDLTALNEQQLDAYRGSNIGIVFQQSHLIKALNVEENLKTAQYLSGNQQDEATIKALLQKLNLAHKIKSKPQHLSLGEQQRVSIARALINKPVLILADEPTSSLDDKNCNEVIDLLLSQSKASEASLLIVTHDARLKDRFEQQILLEEVISS
jgi:putative ABC transport system ATP-binding protein